MAGVGAIKTTPHGVAVAMASGKYRQMALGGAPKSTQLTHLCVDTSLERRREPLCAPGSCARIAQVAETPPCEKSKTLYRNKHYNLLAKKLGRQGGDSSAARTMRQHVPNWRACAPRSWPTRSGARMLRAGARGIGHACAGPRAAKSPTPFDLTGTVKLFAGERAARVAGESGGRLSAKGRARLAHKP